MIFLVHEKHEKHEKKPTFQSIFVFFVDKKYSKQRFAEGILNGFDVIDYNRIIGCDQDFA